MSPTEDELRAMLRAGEGSGGIDADAVLARARGERHARRLRWGSVAAAVLVVGGIAAGVTTLRQGGSPAPQGAQPGATKPGVSPLTTVVPSRGAATTLATSDAASTCPAVPANLMLPGGGGTGQFGGDGPVFAKPVQHLVMCGYRESGSRLALSGAVAVDGAQAQAIADSLNDAMADGRRMYSCAAEVSATALVLQVQGQPAVVVRIGCVFDDNAATNGTAVRYNWTPPRAVWPALDGLLGTQIQPPPSDSGPGAPASVPPGRQFSHGPAPQPTR